MTFRDYFSQQARQYAQHRPGYPGELFDYLASLAPSRELAWDCGTGNGQAALGLAHWFERVIATDGSAEQIENAFPHERVEYRVERAEATSILSGTVDLITVGQAVHWFDFDAFYDEARRVAKQAGILAVWTYHLPSIAPEVDRWLERYYRETLRAYWPERIRYLDEGYRTLPFPFEEIQPPEFFMETEWDLDCLVGFLVSWSGTRRYFEAGGQQSFEHELEELKQSWGGEKERRTIKWPLHFRIGRLPADNRMASLE